MSATQPLSIAAHCRYAMKNCLLPNQLFTMLREIAWQRDDSDQQAAIAGQLTRLRATAGEQGFDQAKQDGFERLRIEVERSLVGTWKPVCGP